jgi:hypothetical protein
LAIDLAFDGEDGGDLLQRLTGDGRLGLDVFVEELAPRVGPARDRFQPRAAALGVRLIELVEAGVGVGVQEAARRRQQGLGVLALPVRRVAVIGGRRIGRAPGPFVAHNHP